MFVTKEGEKVNITVPFESVSVKLPETVIEVDIVAIFIFYLLLITMD